MFIGVVIKAWITRCVSTLQAVGLRAFYRFQFQKVLEAGPEAIHISSIARLRKADLRHIKTVF